MQNTNTLAFDLKSLNIFITVAEAGSMTAAAEQLGMSQPAVTKTIRKLENDLGAPLLERRVRPFRPTQAGQELLERAHELLAQAEALQASVRDIGDATLPTVRIGLIDSFAATAGPGLIRAMRDYAKNMTVWSGISPNLGDDLIRRKLDFIVSTDPMTSLGGVERHIIMQEPFLLVLPERMARSIGEPDLNSLAQNHPFVGYSVRSLIGEQIETHLTREDINVGETLQFDGTEAVFAMVSAGLGWAITTPLCLTHGFAHMPSLSALPLPGRSLSRTLYLVAREGEFGKLPKRIATDARRIAQELVETRVKTIAPWAAKEISVG
ncbi:MAG: LysR family transcriptional regulator [Rhodospirillales bacterium]|jgi:DNA-binding transcriptional LysR family regulator|nr:LysR family transcriptional regulator [Rhodospirillales bacterium]MBT4040978.1 LysR family transcriptional regulator [Rhodospirillales bacterium]MBT4625620.1 LysR family transcriptional regulator [Rhodospirillales bacterium]MBT5350211.1 LysR family transcriptional regulator [Rhodospirillales bacterium]MBT5521679.1 LysR family transcriptional regulator [Rhodospirillales bacterium]